MEAAQKARAAATGRILGALPFKPGSDGERKGLTRLHYMLLLPERGCRLLRASLEAFSEKIRTHRIGAIAGLLRVAPPPAPMLG